MQAATKNRQLRTPEIGGWYYAQTHTDELHENITCFGYLNSAHIYIRCVGAHAITAIIVETAAVKRCVQKHCFSTSFKRHLKASSLFRVAIQVWALNWWLWNAHMLSCVGRPGADHPRTLRPGEGITGVKVLHCGVKRPHMIVKSLISWFKGMITQRKGHIKEHKETQSHRWTSWRVTTKKGQKI